MSRLWIYKILHDLLNLSVLAWTTVNRFCSLRLWLWRGICGLSLTDIFSQVIDIVFLDELLVFQLQTLILYILDQVLNRSYTFNHKPGIFEQFQVFIKVSSFVVIPVRCYIITDPKQYFQFGLAEK